MDPAAGAVVMSFFPPGRIGSGSRSCATARPIPSPPPPSAAAWAGSTRQPPAAPTSPPASRPTPSSTTSGSSRTCSPPARAHPGLAPALGRLARRTATTKLALVHGDVSPKNILLGPDGPVFLDAECAWYGDPAFDLAFCLNHLLLKCLWVPDRHRASSPASTRCWRATSSVPSGSRRRSWRRGRPPCCLPCSWRGSTASHRSST